METVWGVNTISGDVICRRWTTGCWWGEFDDHPDEPGNAYMQWTHQVPKRNCRTSASGIQSSKKRGFQDCMHFWEKPNACHELKESLLAAIIWSKCRLYQCLTWLWRNSGTHRVQFMHLFRHSCLKIQQHFSQVDVWTYGHCNTWFTCH